MAGQLQPEYQNILITDLQFHAKQPRKPSTLLRLIKKFLRTGKPERTYATKFEIRPDNTWQLEMDISPEDQAWIEKLEREGKKLRIVFPRNLMMGFGKDLQERLEADERKAFKRS